MAAHATVVLLALTACVQSQLTGDPQLASASRDPAAEQEPGKPLVLPSEKDLGKRAMAHVTKIVGFGPRISGSKQRKRAADYIVARLAALGLKPIREPWTDKAEGIRFENLRVVLPGRTKKRILIGSHYDTKRELDREKPTPDTVFTGANDGGSGAGLMLALAEDLAPRGLDRPSLEFVWLDGEESLEVEWNRDRALFGSREFVRRHILGDDGKPKQNPYAAFILLDMVGDEDLHIDADKASTQSLIPPFRAAAARLGYTSMFFQHDTDVDDDHVPFLDAGVPSLDLIQFEHNERWHTYNDTIEHISPRSLAIVGRVLLAALPELERTLLR